MTSKMEDSPASEEKSGAPMKTTSSDELAPLKEEKEAEATCGVNKDLIVPKLSFFFYYMAMGAFLPYLGVYYKQLWLNARESGILLGIRPFMKMLCSPIWGVLTDYFHKPKLILLVSIIGSMVAHWSQSIVSPFELPCYVRNNYTNTTNVKPDEVVPIIARSISSTQNHTSNLIKETNYHFLSQEKFDKVLDKTVLKKYKSNSQNKRKSESGKLNEDEPDFPFEINLEANPALSGKDFNELYKDDRDFDSPYKSQSAWEELPKDLEQQQVRKGKTNNEFAVQSHLSSPFARTIMIKNKKVKSPKPDTDFRIRDNKKIYLTLLILIIFGEMVAAPAPMLTDSGTLTLLSGREHEYGKQRLFGSLGWGAGALIAGAIVTAFHKCPYSDNINYVPVFYVFAVAMFFDFIATSFFKFQSQESDNESESKAQKCIESLMPFKNMKNAAFIFVLFFCGFLHSLKLSFLFWFLQDIGGTPILFTLILLINSLSEVLMFFVATYIVKKLGHDAVLYIGLWCYAIKYLLYSYIEHPWYVLPVEALQGVTHGLVWTAGVSYVIPEPGSGATIQGVIHGVYWGLGMAVGGVLGGFLIHVIGARTTFRIMTGCSLVILIGFYILNSVYEKSHTGYMEVTSTEPSKKKQHDEKD